MKLLRISLPTVTLLAGVLMQTPAPRQPIDVAKLGPQVSERVPDFSLKDQTGKTQTLQTIIGPKGAMLVFVRSAYW